MIILIISDGQTLCPKMSSLDSFAHLIDPLLLQWIGGDTFAQSSGRSLSIHEIIVDLFLMIKAVGNAGVNIGKAQSGESLGYLLCRRAVAIVIDHGIQADARAGNPDRSVRRYCQWDRLGGFNNCHDANYSRFSTRGEASDRLISPPFFLPLAANLFQAAFLHPKSVRESSGGVRPET